MSLKFQKGTLTQKKNCQFTIMTIRSHLFQRNLRHTKEELATEKIEMIEEYFDVMIA